LFITTCIKKQLHLAFKSYQLKLLKRTITSFPVTHQYFFWRTRARYDVIIKHHANIRTSSIVLYVKKCSSAINLYFWFFRKSTIERSKTKIKPESEPSRFLKVYKYVS